MEKEENFIEVVSAYGTSFKVDASNKSCGRFQIPDKNGIPVPATHGMEVALLNDDESGVVQGVAPCNITRGDLVLWVNFKTEGETKGRVYYSSSMSWVRV